ncbi:MAG: serine/threonine-protein kinase [Planctomycetota bacterium]|nr:serine/threonine-protein kinase [Planctomycetota bacterium]
MQPSQLGPYRILRQLGRGGMGAVYEAEDMESGDHVAVKVLAAHLSEDPGIRSRFLAEIETLKNLRSPSIVRLLSFGEQDGQPFFAMELVRGRSLDQLLREGTRFDWRTTVDTAIAVTRALKSAHDHGVIHRDLKPGNLLVTDDGTVKLADFGIAKLFGGDAHTAQGNFVGTADYMAPEQASGKLVDQRVDLYALGLVMFAMLAGRPPFRGSHLSEVIEKQRKEKPPRIASLVEDVPAELDELIDRLLAKKPATRPPNALALGRLLAAIRTLRTGEGALAAAATETGSPTVGRSLLDSSAQTVTPASGPGTATNGNERPTTGRDSSGNEIDLLAATREVSDDLPLPPAVDVDLPGGELGATQRPLREFTQAHTGHSTSTTHVERSNATRFTTVAEIEQAEAKRAERITRRQRIASSIVGAVIATLLLGGGWWLLQPPSADLLYARITTVADNDEADLRDAEPLIREFLDRYPNDSRAETVEGYAASIEVASLARQARRDARRRGQGIDAIERDYRTAMALEELSPSACLSSLEAVALLHNLAIEGSNTLGEQNLAETSVVARRWQTLIQQDVARLTPLASQERLSDRQRLATLFAEADSLLEQALGETDETQRQDRLARRDALLRGIIMLYRQRPHAAEAVARAQRLLADGAAGPSETPLPVADSSNPTETP